MPQAWEPEPYVVVPGRSTAPPPAAPPEPPPLAESVEVPVYRPAHPAPTHRRRMWPLVLVIVGASVAWSWGDLVSLAEAFRADRAPAYELPAASSLSAEAPADGYPILGSTDLVRHFERELMAQTRSIEVTEWVGLNDDLDAVWDAYAEALTQNPYLYVESTSAYRRPGHVELIPHYTYDAEEAERRRAVTVSAARAGLDAAGVADAPDAATKVERIYGYIAAVAEYDDAAALEIEAGTSSDRVSHSQEAYSILVDGYAVCGGYAKAFLAMAHLAGLEAIEVTGSDSAGQFGGSHAWNKVKVDGAWRLVDITWDDAGAYAADDYLLLGSGDPILSTRAEDSDWMTDTQMAAFRG
ncbi:transglutaminase domain-containing protein [Demequina silvatica]|uniref:transglutaminase domain-containing protein n=1 Tax=Demequina silvatica TaxID=1638988 RepID=UPI000A83B702|nr:transglutaminase domain-containing protein [Demequina silvatica]